MDSRNLRAQHWCRLTRPAAAAAVAIAIIGSHGTGGPCVAPVLATESAATRDPMAPPQTGYEPNLGQWDTDARFVFRNGPMTLLARDTGWVVALLAGDARAGSEERASTVMRQRTARAAAFRMTFEDAAAAAEPRGEWPQPARRSYFLGDASRWRADVPHYASVHYRDLYPGIDVRLREAGGSPEYDLLLAPGANLAAVRVRVDGAQSLHVDGDGALVIETAVGPVVQPAPHTWQRAAGGSDHAVTCGYVLHGADRYGFEVDGWDRRLPLTIDPGLRYSSALPGGTVPGAKPTRALAVSTDDLGIVTIAGTTAEPLFPTTMGAFDVTHGALNDAYVCRLDPGLTGAAQLVYSTFLGGPGGERIDDLQVDDAGVITVVGRSNSWTLPTTAGAFDRTPNGRADVFVAQLDPSQAGTAQFLYGSVIGGSGGDVPGAVAVDDNGIITITGDTDSPLYPTTADAYDSVYSGGTPLYPQDSFITRLDPSQTGSAQLAYSTFIGGTGFEYSTALAVGDNGVITIGGETSSSDLAISAGAFDPVYDGQSDGFVLMLDPTRTGSAQLVYSTFLGGTATLGLGYDLIYTLDVDSFGVVTVGGLTHCDDFPVTGNAFANTFNGGVVDGFVAQLDPSLTGSAQLVYSTYFGGLANERVEALAVTNNRIIDLVGETDSTDFPTTTGAFDQIYGGATDGFVARLDPQRTGAAQLLYSTFLGGPTTAGGGYDSVFALSVDPLGIMTVVGESSSNGFPVTPTAFASPGIGSKDAFVSQLDLLPKGIEVFGASTPGCTGPLAIGVTSMPQIGNAGFAITCNNAPPSGAGWVAFGSRGLQTPLTAYGGWQLWVDPFGAFLVLRSVQSDAGGFAEYPLPIANQASVIGRRLDAQFFWVLPAAPPPCPQTTRSASNAIEIVVQP